MLASSPAASAAYRRRQSPKQLEAQVFAHVTRQLRTAQGEADARSRARAVSDAQRLWLVVEALVLDPTNQLLVLLRAQLAGIARAALRECDAGEPDISFLTEMTEQVGAGLWS